MASLLLIPILLQQTLVEGELLNHTIDDTLGDESTGVQVDYSPSSQPSNGSTLVWRNASLCSDCAIVPDRSFAMNGTWTGATYYSSLENTTAGLKFHGMAIYIYLIVSNYPKSTGLVSDVICDFRMDGKIVGHYSHDTDGTYQFQYDVLAYSNASLNDGDHTLLIEITGSDSSYVIFDYAVYTNSQVFITFPTIQNPASTTSEPFETSGQSVSLSSAVLSFPAPRSTTSEPLGTPPYTSVSVSSPMPSSLATSSSAASSSSNLVKTFAGAIAVGLLAVAIVVISFCIYFYRRRRRINASMMPAVPKQQHLGFLGFFSLSTPTIKRPAQVPRNSLDEKDNSQETSTAYIDALRSRSSRLKAKKPLQESAPCIHNRARGI